MFSAIFQATLLQWYWWTQAVGPNVAAVVPCAILTCVGTFVWSRTRFWPTKLFRRRMDRIEKRLVDLAESHESIHRKLDDFAAR